MNDPGKAKELHRTLDPETFELFQQFLENQTQELSIRRQQVELSRVQIENNYQYAQKALAAEVEDRERQRDHELKVQRNAMIFIAVMVFVIAAFLTVALYVNKEGAMEIIKFVGYLILAGGGYAIGRRSLKQSGGGS